jgi:RNA polymerase sigma factor (sigma-70 family)
MQEGIDDVHQFCRQLRPRLVGTLSLMCGDREVAQELAQETMARVWVNWPKIRDLGDQVATAWTYRVAVNLSKSWIRRRVAERRALARLSAQNADRHSDPDPADAVAVRRAVASLSRRQRTAVVLRFYADLPVAEVAALMGCAPGTVKALTGQAMSALRGLVHNDRGGVR